MRFLNNLKALTAGLQFAQSHRKLRNSNRAVSNSNNKSQVSMYVGRLPLEANKNNFQHLDLNLGMRAVLKNHLLCFLKMPKIMPLIYANNVHL